MTLSCLVYDDARSVEAKSDPSQPSDLHGFFGGVRDSTGLYIESSRSYRSAVIPVVYPPKDDDTALPSETLAGTSLFAGPIYFHFGHFILESLSRLWAASRQPVDRVVFQAPEAEGRQIGSFQADFLKAYLPSTDIVIISKAYRFERLLLPDPAFVINSFASPEFVEVFDQITGVHAPRRDRSLYVTRAHADVGVAVGEELIADAFSRAGYEVIAAEALSFAERLAAFGSVLHIAGIQGSNMHNVLLSAPGTSSLTIVRDANDLRNYRLIDRIKAVKATYIPGVDLGIEMHEPYSAQGPFIVNFDKLKKGLRSTPFAYIADYISLPDKDVLRDRFVAEWEYIRSQYEPERFDFEHCKARVQRIRKLGLRGCV